ncbi:MAG TPA: ricin-type beta-trefoil lectin domain protein [Polyangiaceae bacterium]|nr:ricin-type beta-trefoil lectin domain protein [Polyangiaceae bacterium]
MKKIFPLAFLFCASGLPFSACDDASTSSTDGESDAGDPTSEVSPKLVVGSTEWAPDARPPAGFASWAELMRLQSQLNDAATRIQQAAEASPRNGYAGVIAAPENQELIVYWQGVVPPDVQAVIDEQKALVPVRVVSARYTQSQLLAEVQRLAANPDFGEVGPRIDGSGVEVRWAKGRSAAPDIAATDLLASASVAVFVTSADGEVAPTLFDCADGASYCREDDTPAYWAGARTEVCTVGWAINWNGSSRLLTAGHCANNGDMVRDGGGDNMATVFNDNDSRDTQMIGASGGARMWDGGWQNSTFTKPVVGATPSNVGNWICTSGSRTGARCHIQVKATNVSFAGTFPMVRAEHMDKTTAAGQGDSGGPVFELSFDHSHVIAKGTITGGDGFTQTPCVGENWAGRVCAWRIYYADVSQTLANYGASMATAPGIGPVRSALAFETKCLDVRNGNPADGTPIQIHSCNGTEAQRWAREGSTLKAFGKCLDVVGGGTADGTGIQLWPCNEGGAQEWVPGPNGSLRNPQSGKCLDVFSADSSDGTPVILWSCNGNLNQWWTLP